MISPELFPCIFDQKCSINKEQKQIFINNMLMGLHGYWKQPPLHHCGHKPLQKISAKRKQLQEISTLILKPTKWKLGKTKTFIRIRSCLFIRAWFMAFSSCAFRCIAQISNLASVPLTATDHHMLSQNYRRRRVQ